MRPLLLSPKLDPAEAGSEKGRVACHAVVLETFPPVATASGLFPLGGEVAQGSRWVQESEHATY